MFAPRAGTRWTLSDDQWLWQNQDLSVPQLAAHLQRSDYAIKCRLDALNDPKSQAYGRRTFLREADVKSATRSDSQAPAAGLFGAKFEEKVSTRSTSRSPAAGGWGFGSSTFLYTLRLEDECWYVGTTTNPRERLEKHRSGQGSAWTREHRVIGDFHNVTSLHCDPQEARLEEDKITKKLMLRHGLQLVRGGSYCQVELSTEEIKTLKRELFHATNGCLRCGRMGHLVGNCFARTDVYDEPIIGVNDDDVVTACFARMAICSSSCNEVCEEEV